MPSVMRSKSTVSWAFWVLAFAFLSRSAWSFSDKCKEITRDVAKISNQIRATLTDRLTDKYFDAANEFQTQQDLLKAKINVGLQEDCGPVLSTLYNNLGCLYYLQGQHMQNPLKQI